MLLRATPALWVSILRGSPVSPRFEVEGLLLEQRHQQHLPLCPGAAFQMHDRELRWLQPVPRY